MKTNAARILDQRQVRYRIATYEVDESDLSAPTVARKIGLPPEQVFKTLLLHGDKTGYLFALVAAEEEIDLKKLAQASGNKRVEMVPMKDLQQLTGYIRGGVSPLGAKKAFPVFLDEKVILYDEIALSAGMRGAQLVVPSEQLQQVLDATLCDIAAPTMQERKG